MVNWLLPIRLTPLKDPPGEVDYLALRHQLLPRVPVAGEAFVLPGLNAEVSQVTWRADGRVTVRLVDVAAAAAYLDTLTGAGWDVFTRHDADALLWS